MSYINASWFIVSSTWRCEWLLNKPTGINALGQCINPSRLPRSQTTERANTHQFEWWIRPLQSTLAQRQRRKVIEHYKRQRQPRFVRHLQRSRVGRRLAISKYKQITLAIKERCLALPEHYCNQTARKQYQSWRETGILIKFKVKYWQIKDLVRRHFVCCGSWSHALRFEKKLNTCSDHSSQNIYTCRTQKEPPPTKPRNRVLYSDL